MNPSGEGALFGVFSGHVNVTDGRYVYMRAAQPGREHDIANYTFNADQDECAL
ncbi:sulfatase [Salmonella enterica subsp. enterica]|uniref:Sulfatase n=1 Tax=Salmonella enterica I TaxID=59201 RepID=A0A3S4FNI7_SALET|nr:sulfatase [Salmonella enterica subsp. enterica]